MPGIIPNFTIPFLVTLACIAAMRPAARSIGLVAKPGGRKSHVGEVPVVGGLCMLVGLLIGSMFIVESLRGYPSLITGALILGVVGAFDDRFELRASTRLFWQFAVGVVAIIGGQVVVSLGHFGSIDVVLPLVAAWVFTLLTIAAFTNALNWQDGSDGLAGAQAFVCLLGMLVIDVADTGSRMQAIATLVSCIAAFLLVNAPQRNASSLRCFMGDAGALFLGFSLAWLAIDMTQGPHAAMAPVTALWIGALPVLDFFCCILRRVMTARRPFDGDAEHLHHLLMRAGLSRQGLFLVETASCALFATIGLIGHFLSIDQGVMLVGMAVVFVVYFWVFGSGRFFQREGDPLPHQPRSFYFPIAR